MRRLWPHKKIVLVCRSGVGKLLHQLGLVDSVFEIVKGNAESYQTIKREISQLKIDHIICPHESVRTALLVFGLKAESKTGFRNWWNGLVFSNRVKKRLELPDALRQLSLLNDFDPNLKVKLHNIDVTQFVSKDIDGKLQSVPDWASSLMRDSFTSGSVAPELEALTKGKPLALLFPGSVWATKRWRVEGFIAVAKKLESSGYQVCWMGSSIEKSLCEELDINLKSGNILAGSTSLYETCWLMARSEIVIGNDSSSSHMASLTGTPVIAVFGPTVLNFGFRPWHNQAYIAEADLFCRPCGPHGHHQCPRGTHDCMKLVKPEDVWKQAETILLDNVPSTK